MASRHVSGDRSLLRDLKACAPITLVAANGSKVIVDQVGEVQLQVRAVNGVIAHIRVERVYFNKQCNNLLSWNKLSANGWTLHSSMAESYVKTPSALGGARLPLVFKRGVSMLVDETQSSAHPSNDARLANEAALPPQRARTGGGRSTTPSAMSSLFTNIAAMVRWTPNARAPTMERVMKLTVNEDDGTARRVTRSRTTILNDDEDEDDNDDVTWKARSSPSALPIPKSAAAQASATRASSSENAGHGDRVGTPAVRSI